MENTNGRSVYLVYVNGQFYYTSESDYNKNKNHGYYIYGYNNIQKAQ
jgi:hypothetical protein